MIILQPSDFIGFQGLPQGNLPTAKILVFINRYERKYLNQILGVTLAGLLIADLDPVTHIPQTTRFLNIFNAIDIQQATGDVSFVDNKIHHSLGLKDILLCLIFFHFIVDTQVSIGQAGVVQSSADGVRSLSPREAARTAEKVWNDSLEYIEAIQWYCYRYLPATYPEYLGIHIPVQYQSML